MKILIDPGHGGSDPGATYGTLREADINLAVSLYLASELALAGLTPVLTRYHDQTLSLPERVSVETTHEPDLFLSIHSNAAPLAPRARGFEVFTSPGQTLADAAATRIADALQAGFRTWPLRTDPSDGDPDKEARFYVLRKTHCPAVLVELGFLTNPIDRTSLAEDTHRRLLALTLAHGVSAWWAERAVA